MAIRRPLDGMLVLDLGQIYNGPYCGLMLGFMGLGLVVGVAALGVRLRAGDRLRTAAQVGREALQAFLPPRHQDQRVPPRGKFRRDRSADPGRGAGDERGAADRGFRQTH